METVNTTTPRHNFAVVDAAANEGNHHCQGGQADRPAVPMERRKTKRRFGALKERSESPAISTRHFRRPERGLRGALMRLLLDTHTYLGADGQPQAHSASNTRRRRRLRECGKHLGSGDKAPRASWTSTWNLLASVQASGFIELPYVPPTPQ
jgi:hypothetical protein